MFYLTNGALVFLYTVLSSFAMTKQSIVTSLRSHHVEQKTNVMHMCGKSMLSVLECHNDQQKTIASSIHCLSKLALTQRIKHLFSSKSCAHAVLYPWTRSSLLCFCCSTFLFICFKYLVSFGWSPSNYLDLFTLASSLNHPLKMQFLAGNET